MKKKIFKILLSLMLLGNVAVAQENEENETEDNEIYVIEDDRNLDLGKIVISPYKTAVKRSLNPSSTDIILVDDMNNQGIFSLKDAIKNIPSLSYQTTGGIGGVTGLHIRGAEAHHTQVLIDGIQLYDPIVTSRYFYGYNYMSLDNLERIEVLKGPYSSLYGSDSIGGTISLMTKKGRGKPTISFTQEIGSYQTYREKLSSQGEIDKFAYSLSVSKVDINSFYSAKFKNGNHEEDPFHNLNSCLRIDYTLADNIDIGLMTNYVYAKYEYDGDSGWPSYLPADSDNKLSRFHQGVNRINLDHRITDFFSHKVIMGYTRTYRKDWTSESANSWFNGETYQAKWQGDYRLCDFDKIIFGFDYLRELGESRSFDPTWGNSTSPIERNNSKGYYIENVFTPFNNLFFSASYRLEDHSEFKKHDFYSVSSSYTIEKTNTKIIGSFGEGFKAPSLYQLFDSQYGNQDLDPEVSENYEVGFEQKLSNGIKFGSTYFHNHIKNLIEWTFPSGYANAGKSKIYGIENLIEFLFFDNHTLTISYTHMDTEKLSDGSRLLRRPNNKITCKLKSEFEKLDLYADVSYVGNRIDTSNVKLKSYIIGNIALNYEVNEKIDIFFRFENILNYDYELVNDYQTPKFSVYTGIKIEF